MDDAELTDMLQLSGGAHRGIKFKKARYIYVVEVYNGINEVFEIEIDGKTGKILEIDD